ncbi:MAG: hypothetical protein UX49_C0021G0010 [Candidatus Wolfebacteria bacterium GW2011_GWC2_46_275]|uniref:Uncharacterized protein n=2 Tax=Candidatus Wolfeibacteriota TaxID=1752735 RepID=A0A0G1WJP0_9BACT|nr:MAG: hypothetical protein UX70_C0001G0809 [Candidatus Wolfebacteria bacterium GW2011_GWB1_47_1]KKU36186.1 MAG: hypothetical protein UX49_C0021G0010 [Candidatus Wolfebacteria bacterium GW2011_GWC2_46_275]KKU42097.1 MAG: hypothetical protein UX58_C0003G0021 [Candidatus Wolfebacteria bacterium GW2011_GWB2_46_69]KKU59314.1 MAG: hypothetical protein UX83_C0006G0084 [Candidatus Wolfebacteria bacterium GW2011_GWE2_47_12]KKU66064.1 MAG: hypothetical protein UX90_C0001G0123 [Candidatus Wolfebacteria 
MAIYAPRPTSDRLDFETHLKYAALIAKLSNNLEIISSPNSKLPKSEGGKLKDKIQLVRLTKKSIDQEYEIVCFDEDYSSASVLWLPVKTYYLIYHLLCISDCIISGKMSSLTAGHHECVNAFTKMLESSEIQFNKPLLNLVFGEEILSFTTQAGEHLKTGVADDTIYRLLMKKVANDKIDNYKIVNGLSGRRTKDKIRIDNFKRNIKVSIFDFFHLMRLRTNYRNLNFVDNIPASGTKLYFEKYYISADNFYKCFTKYINELMKNCV